MIISIDQALPILLRYYTYLVFSLDEAIQELNIED